ncbi:lipopolysaccharide biosynthesis protein [Comamonas piscis]|uniref:Lipopolysaccharide biosynthesis protein n=1 Tax=Comamonas piscis TaxID=1562974 RepID=A0A7G5EDE5_9BURK|nr:lipopolysaccharide biosynthesis protein [Comamonas piscis]QMV72020.1 lipopolysaccharide biosynthesis protein [Comamonas piscis]WSO34765.1 lipopolysaccharide biosynthesis protein [Comamonas piscis]
MAEVTIGSSLRWLLTGRAVQIAVQFIGIATLARLIAPAEFGLLALASVVTAFLQLFTDMGTASALIQRRDLENRHINAVFWFNVAIGFLLAGLLAATSPALAEWLGNERAAPVLLALSASFPLTTLVAAHAALLERESKFRELTLYTTISSVFGLAVAISLAVKGAGVFALVFQSLATASAQAIMLWRASRWRPGRPSMNGLRELIPFSGNLFLFNIVNYIHRNSDTIIIGRIFSQQDLGLYNIAYRILLFPLQNFTFAVNRALLPAYSRNQDEVTTLAAHYVSTLRGIALITAPLMAAIWATREPLIELLLGSAWARSSDVIQWLAPVGFLQSVVSTSGSVLLSRGKSSTLRTLGLVGAPFLTASFIVGIPWGIEGIAASYCLANVIWLFPVLATVMKSLDGRLGSALAAIVPPAAISIAAFACASWFATPTQSSAVSHLLSIIALGSIFFLAGTRIFLWKSVKSFLHVLPSVRLKKKR